MSNSKELRNKAARTLRAGRKAQASQKKGAGATVYAKVAGAWMTDTQ